MKQSNATAPAELVWETPGSEFWVRACPFAEMTSWEITLRTVHIKALTQWLRYLLGIPAPTAICHRCRAPFPVEEVSVCSVQPSPKTSIVTCAEKPWVDPSEEQRLKQRTWMHELIWWLKGGASAEKKAPHS